MRDHDIDMKPFQTYIALLEHAKECLDAVDNFDLHSESPDSVRIWEEYLRLEYNANFALIAFVSGSHEEILTAMKAARDTSRI